MGRAVVLPRFTLNATRHNHDIQLPGTDLREYLSLEHIPVETVTIDGFSWGAKDAVTVEGLLDPCEWRGCRAPVLLRPCMEGFWKNEVHDAVYHLAGELHGAGMKPTPGLFAPSSRVAEAAAWAAAKIDGPYIGVHVRRGDKLEMMPGLAAGTSAGAVACAVAAIAPPGIDRVYVATNDPSVDYAGALKARGFRCFVASDVDWANAGTDNYMLFAVEMKLVDDAALCIRTFNDATAWYFSTKRKPSYHLLDRSMHDYIFGFSRMGTDHFHMKSPVAMASLDLEEAEETLRKVGSRHAFLPVEGLPRFPPINPICHLPYSVAVAIFAGSCTRNLCQAFYEIGQQPTLWEMHDDGQGVFSAEVDVSSSGCTFTIVLDGDVRRSLRPATVGRWPLEVEAVAGPGEPATGRCAWRFGGAAPGVFAVRLETCGSRAVSAWQVSA